jgi:hypothetical protein
VIATSGPLTHVLILFHLVMGQGTWTRWGRGSCEGWSLWLGDIVRGQIRRGIDVPPTWSASFNSTDLGDYATRDEAMARVEEAVVRSMGEAMADWAIFRPRAKPPVG